MPSSTKILIKALEYVRTHEPVESINSEQERIAPLLIFEKLHNEGYISGLDAKSFGVKVHLLDVKITLRGLEYLETLKGKRFRAKIISSLWMLLWAIIGVLLTLAGQLFLKP